jgi:hypothetical protein
MSVRIAERRGPRDRAALVARGHCALVGDIRDGIISNVSPGYITHSYREELRNGLMYRIATDWEPVEISFVAVGADA